MLVHQAFGFELDPNDVARSALASHAGAARYAYNWALALVLDRGRWRGKAGLNRALLDASPAELRRQLAYKCAWYGSALVVADRWYPSSKTCSACGRRKPSLPLAERTYRCEDPGCANHAGIDRDLNAAINLAALVRAATGTGSGPGTGQGDLANGRGDERFMGSPKVLVDEPSRRHRLDAGQDRHRHPATGGSGARSRRK